MSAILWLVGAFFVLGGLRGAWPHVREHRRIRRQQHDHRRRLWQMLAAKGYDVTPWRTARKTGQLLQSTTWNELQAQLEIQTLEEREHHA